MTFKQGQSGNPGGRPPKGRALTDILERAGAATLDVDSKKVSGKQLIARMVWELATTGQVTLPGGKTLIAEPEEWIATVKWIYQHIDGPAKQEIKQEVTGTNGGELVLRVIYDTGNSNKTEPNDNP